MLLAVTLAIAAPIAPPPPPDDWEAMIDGAVPAIVTIKVSSTRAFDTEGASNSTATGFVVDAKRGIILTNRHVVEPGPVVAEAIFSTQEEVPLRAIYRDPVHDFGFYQFDPALVKFQTVTALELRPEHARVGGEIRVVGSDNAEKLAILSGTIARLDRDAPRYGANKFNDFNTYYIQAASGTSGGSSGSPVLDAHGHAIALNAGSARGAATSFFLPLDRVTRALALIQGAEPVSRGTLQTVFVFKTFDETRRLGLRAETEAELRQSFPDTLGALVVDEVVPGGPADGSLAPGDVLLGLAGAPIRDFAALEALLDTRVGETIPVSIARGGRPVEVPVRIDDLHALTPAAYLEFGGAVLNRLSFQQARNHTVPVGGVYVATAGYVLENAGIPAGSVIVEVAGTATTTLSAFEAAMAGHADGDRVPVRFFSIEDPRRTQVAVIRVDRRWFPMQLCTRDDRTGVWPCVASAAPGGSTTPVPTRFTPLSGDSKPAAVLSPSLVWVRDTLPYRTGGVYGTSFTGTGVVVDVSRGYVLVDRDTVPVPLGDVTLTFGGAVEIPARVVAVHPTHNLTLLQYAPALLAGMTVVAPEWRSERLEPNEAVWHVGLAGSGELQSKATTITRFDPLFIPIPRVPGFRDSNLEVYDIDGSARAVGGVLADKRGRVVALYASFVDNSGDKPNAAFRGIATETVQAFLQPILTGAPLVWRNLGAELVNTSLAGAIQRGLSPESAARLLAAAPDRREVLQVWRRTAGSPAASVLQEGDLVLALGDRWAPQISDVNEASRAERVTLTVLRGGSGKEETVSVATQPAESDGPTRLVAWAGALIQDVPSSLATQRGFADTGLYVTSYAPGAPASRYGLATTLRILAIDERPVATLDELLDAVSGRPDRSSVRVQVKNLDGRAQVITLKLDLQYWPTFELVMKNGQWDRLPR